MKDAEFVGAVALACLRVAPDQGDKSFLERRLERALVHELDLLRPGRVRANQKLPGIAIPDWDPQPGWLDIAVVDENDEPVVVAELKLDDVDQTIWDIFKLASATRLPSVRAAYMVVGAPPTIWVTSLAAVPFYEGHTEKVWSSKFVFEEYKVAWKNLLNGGRGRPLRVPSSLVLTPLLTTHVPAYPDYELRILKVSDLNADAFIELREGWPFSRRPGEILDDELALSDLPPHDAPEIAYHEFALTTNGYERMGSVERCGELANGALDRWNRGRELPTDVRDLRCCLYFEQRRWHHYGYGFDEEAFAYVRALVGAIGWIIESRETARADESST